MIAGNQNLLTNFLSQYCADFTTRCGCECGIHPEDAHYNYDVHCTAGSVLCMYSMCSSKFTGTSMFNHSRVISLEIKRLNFSSKLKLRVVLFNELTLRITTRLANVHGKCGKFDFD